MRERLHRERSAAAARTLTQPCVPENLSNTLLVPALRRAHIVQRHTISYGGQVKEVRRRTKNRFCTKVMQKRLDTTNTNGRWRMYTEKMFSKQNSVCI